MKQTAVEWLIDQLIPKDQHEGIMDIIEQAKEMEKEQIMDAANKLLYHSTGPSDTAAEQYYNETYKK
jgi:hypothetical protein